MEKKLRIMKMKNAVPAIKSIPVIENTIVAVVPVNGRLKPDVIGALRKVILYDPSDSAVITLAATAASPL